MVSPGPSDHRPRAQIASSRQLQPAFARGERGNIPNLDGIGFRDRTFPVELVRGHPLGLPRSQGRVEPAPRCAAQPRLSQHTSKATPADLQSLWRPELLEPPRAIRATPLRNIALYVALPLLIGCSLRAGRAVSPLVVAPA